MRLRQSGARKTVNNGAQPTGGAVVMVFSRAVQSPRSPFPGEGSFSDMQALTFGANFAGQIQESPNAMGDLYQEHQECGGQSGTLDVGQSAALVFTCNMQWQRG